MKLKDSRLTTFEGGAKYVPVIPSSLPCDSFFSLASGALKGLVTIDGCFITEAVC
jgi:hypothetical protein